MGTILAVAVIIAIIAIIIICIQKFAPDLEENKKWADRRENAELMNAEFEEKLKDISFHSDLSIITQAYYREELVKIFAFEVDYSRKRIAVCSFEEDTFNPVILKFEDIAGVEILDGISNTLSGSYTSGGAVRGNYGVVGSSSTDTYVATLVENIALKIEVKDMYRPAYQILMFRYKIDTSSDIYKNVLKAKEDIKSILNKIIIANSEEQK